ncbi:hypothetical protein RFI_02039 [Reticulomyxa filosa]|uniref:Uncharacterized protein n=1 Tax=Reticulomyxa filosa TaxID=46433 RepID=X6PAE6_RETFI|nr:hypothetical protein RFI_02039 [Reticulomyxa filosa]|eukprot:ETO35034.1 hypothetical protein RFI_02039 [Reticulomyxa filosa]
MLYNTQKKNVEDVEMSEVKKEDKTKKNLMWLYLLRYNTFLAMTWVMRNRIFGIDDAENVFDDNFKEWMNHEELNKIDVELQDIIQDPKCLASAKYQLIHPMEKTLIQISEQAKREFDDTQFKQINGMLIEQQLLPKLKQMHSLLAADTLAHLHSTHCNPFWYTCTCICTYIYMHIFIDYTYQDCTDYIEMLYFCNKFLITGQFAKAKHWINQLDQLLTTVCSRNDAGTDASPPSSNRKLHDEWIFIGRMTVLHYHFYSHKKIDQCSQTLTQALQREECLHRELWKMLERPSSNDGNEKNDNSENDDNNNTNPKNNNNNNNNLIFKNSYKNLQSFQNELSALKLSDFCCSFFVVFLIFFFFKKNQNKNNKKKVSNNIAAIAIVLPFGGIVCVCEVFGVIFYVRLIP